MENPKSKWSLDLSALFGKKNGSSSQVDTKPWSGVTLVRKIALVLLSLLAAMLLWGYVLMSQNPDRTKTFSGVKVALETGSEADLLYKNYMVYGDITEILRDVTVTVSAPLKEITKLTSEDINATVNFNDVHEPGVARLNIRATSSSGAVVSIDPPYYEVEIEKIMSRSIPVDSEFTGSLPEGYWNGPANITPRTITVKGASRIVEQITSAVCRIDLSELTSSVNRSVMLQLSDENGQPVDNSLLIESLPSVNLQMQVLPYKSVEIIPDIAEGLPDGLEITDMIFETDSMVIACDQTTLDALEHIGTETVITEGITGPGVYSYTLALTGIPDNAVVIEGPYSKTIKLTLIVGEARDEKTFTGVAIRVTGASRDLLYTYYLYDKDGVLGEEPLVRLAADVTVTGPTGAVNALNASDIVLLLDVTGLGVGSHDLPLQLIWNDALSTLTGIEHPATIRVVIERAG